MKPIPDTPALRSAAATDAGNASMRAGGRTAWNVDDYNAAIRAKWGDFDDEDEDGDDGLSNLDRMNRYGAKF